MDNKIFSIEINKNFNEQLSILKNSFVPASEQIEMTAYDIIKKFENGAYPSEYADELLSKSVVSIYSIPSYLDYNINTEDFPKTKKIINEFALIALEKYLPIYDISPKWLSEETAEVIAKKYLNEEYHNVINVFHKISAELQFQIFKKIVARYSSNKSSYIVSDIRNVFVKLKDEYLLDCCELLHKSTNAVAACLLARQTEEKYTMRGLKALSKLSNQRKIDVLIDFKMLNNLGPVGRLNAMKQLFGLNSRYNDLVAMPFKEAPSKSEMENFLFPCSLKYNKEVSLIIKRYEELINKTNKEVSNGKCF